MEAYSDFVNRLATTKSSDIVNNSSAEHAIILLSAMFKHGTGEARVLSGGLNPLIYASEKVVEAVTYFLSRAGNKLTVIVQGLDSSNKPMSENAMAAALRENNLVVTLKEKFASTFNDLVSIKYATGAMKDLEFHFMTVGDSFRFEADRARKEAVAGFCNADIVAGLNEVWKNGQTMAKPIDLSHATPVPAN